MPVVIFMVLILTVMRTNGFVDADKYICRCEKFAYENKPFVAIWNSPTNGCDFNFSTPINLKRFGIIQNDHQTWDGKHVTVFASAQLGLYPYFILNGERNYNGGLPQLVDLGQHLRKARKDIELKIPDPNYNGLAVIDWEQWRPLWDTNWDPKKIYKVKSVELVRNKHPDWTLGKMLEEAKKEFEEAARALFEHTITMGKELRPKALWGFYGFPDCYGNEKDDYQCIEKTKTQNDQLEWLFSASSALFPSMYLQNKKTGNHNFVLGRLRETLRFAAKGFGQNRRNIPIFVYHRNIYDEDEHAYNFLQKADLDNTIAVSADLGTAGVVLWGNRFDENTSPEVCRKIENYVYTTLGPYLRTKFQEVEKCSSTNCHNHGHCIDKALLTPELLRRYQTAQGSKHNCSEAISAIPSRLTNPAIPSKLINPVRSEIPTHHNEGDDVSNMLQTLRDRNRDINEAFQASQNGLSRKMGEFFDAMYTNTSIANSTGVHTFNKNDKNTASSQSNGKHDFSNLQNFGEKELTKGNNNVPVPKVKEVETHPATHLINKQRTGVALHANKVERPPAVKGNKVGPLAVPNGTKSQSSITLHVPNPNSLVSPRRPEVVKSLHSNVSKSHSQLHVNTEKPKSAVNVHADTSRPPQTLHITKMEQPKTRNNSKPQQTPIGKKVETLTPLKEKKPTPPATLNVKQPQLSSTVHINTPKAPRPLNEKKLEKSSATSTPKAPHALNAKNTESAKTSTPKAPHPLNAKNSESPKTNTPKSSHPLNPKNSESPKTSTPKAPHPLNPKNSELPKTSTPKAPDPLNAKKSESSETSTPKAPPPLNAKNSESSKISTPKESPPLNTKNTESSKTSTPKAPHPLNTKNLESSAASTPKASHPSNAKNIETSEKIHENKPKSVTPVPIVKFEPVKSTHTNMSKTPTLDVTKSDKSTILNINKGESSSVPNVKKSDIPKLPKTEKSQVEMTLDLGTENEQRSSLEVLGQSAHMGKSVDGVKSSHYSNKDHNSTEDVKARRKSDISQSGKLGTMWQSVTGKASNSTTWIPHMYLILIGTSIAGALMFALMSVAAYYYVNLRHNFEKRKRSHLETDSTQSSISTPNAHSSPISNTAGNYKGIASTVSEIKQFFDLIQKRRENDKRGAQVSDDIDLSTQTDVKTGIVIADVKKIKSQADSESAGSLTTSKSIQNTTEDDDAQRRVETKKILEGNKKVTQKDNKKGHSPKKIQSPKDERKNRSPKNKCVNRSREKEKGRNIGGSRRSLESNDVKEKAESTSNNRIDHCPTDVQEKGKTIGVNKSLHDTNNPKQVEPERNKKKRIPVHTRYHSENVMKNKTKRQNSLSTSTGDQSSRSSETQIRNSKPETVRGDVCRSRRSLSSSSDKTDHSNEIVLEKKTRSVTKIPSPIKSVETKQEYTSVDMDKRNSRSGSSPKKNLSFTERFSTSKRRKNKREFWSDGDDHGDEFEIDLNHMY